MLFLQAVMAAAVLSPVLPRVERHAVRFGAPAALVIVMAAGLVRDGQIVRTRRHLTGLRAAAEILAPGLEGIDPRQPCFISPEWPSMSFYTFRTGRYWESPYTEADPEGAIAALDGGPFFYVIQDDTGLYGGNPDERVMEMIRNEAYQLISSSDDGSGAVSVYANRALREILTPR
jgi:hypothetical protein